MKRAAASEGPDRQRLIELALAWHQLARDRREEERRVDLDSPLGIPAQG